MLYNAILMAIYLEGAQVKEVAKARDTESTISEEVGRVASATFFNTYHELSPPLLKVNGHNFELPANYRTSSLVRVSPRTGQLEVLYHHSAHVAGLLEGHMGMNESRIVRGDEPLHRLFAFVHVTSGKFYDNVQLEQLYKKRVGNGHTKHTAIFTYPADIHDTKNETEALIVPIDDIYCINYAMPLEPVTSEPPEYQPK
jgi:hypothetical protein